MIRRTGFGCGCDAPARSSGMGGIFSEALNVAGSFVGDPMLGDQVASKASRAFAPITQTPDQIAQTVLSDTRAALANPDAINVATITPASQQVAAGVLPQTALALAADGYQFPAGSVGASLVGRPSVLNAFGGQNAEWVLFGGLALGALLLFKEIRA